MVQLMPDEEHLKIFVYLFTMVAGDALRVW